MATMERDLLFPQPRKVFVVEGATPEVEEVKDYLRQAGFESRSSTIDLDFLDDDDVSDRDIVMFHEEVRGGSRGELTLAELGQSRSNGILPSRVIVTENPQLVAQPGQMGHFESCLLRPFGKEEALRSITKAILTRHCQEIIPTVSPN